MNLEGIQNWLDARAPETGSPGVLAPGAVVDGWRVTAYLGHGFSSEVYRVVNAANGCEAALKLFVKDAPDLRHRFDNERKILSSLSPRIPDLPGFYATGEAEGRPYYVMELLEPVELPLPARRIAPFVLALARAVERLHAARHLHRDLKPANLMRRRSGEPVLIDLGLAKPLDSPGADAPRVPSTRLSRAQTSIVDGQLVGVGTVGWAAPEQILEGTCSFASDIFSLGKIARACFAKRPPHVWRVIIRQATHQEPSERYDSVADFRAAIRFRNLPLQIAATLAAILLAAVCALVPSLRARGPQDRFQPDPLPGETSAAYVGRLTRLATADHADAQCQLAECYFHGRHLPKDLNQAYEWYHRAAVNGATGAMVTLGDCYLHGHGHAQDAHEAIRWYREATRRGHLGAQTNLGYCLLNGRGPDHDDAEAIRLISDAARKNHPEAQRMLGECYLHGHGVPPDRIQAELWIRRAADQGNRHARKLLELL